MSAVQPFGVPELPRGAATGDDRPDGDALTAAIRKALDALIAAADEAAMGRLGAAKLGLLVAASGLLDALKAADAEFEKRYATDRAARPERKVSRHGADTHTV
jgi:hypothetical protein